MKLWKVFESIVTIVLIAFLYWLFLPTLSIGYLGGVAFFGICIIALVANIVMWVSEGSSGLSAGAIVFVILAIITGIGIFLGSGFLNAETKRNQLGEIEEKSFTEDITPIDYSQIPVVDIDLATRLADKKLGEDPGLGSQMEVGEFTNKQEVNGKLVYVAPLEHRSLLKWWSNRQGTTGYLIVSATNPNDVKLVQKVNDKDIHLKYINSAYFGSNLTRHIRSSGFRTQGLTEFSFELDDEGNPYWVVTTYKNTTIWSTPEATGVVVCNPQDGNCEWFSVEDAPEWIDIIQPEDFIEDQINNWGKYVHGWWNPSNKDVMQMTPNIVTIYNNGECYYYTGISSVGSDQGTTGYIVVNTRNKKVIWYKYSGATEEAAMRSAEGVVQDMGYLSTKAIPLNVNGIPTYFMTLKDTEGLVKSYALVNIKDYSIASVGNTIAEVMKNYKNAMTNSGNKVVFADEAYGYTLEGKITRISSNVENGNTYYYFIINNDNTKLFMASYGISDELPISREGDNVKVSYLDASNGSIDILTFDNTGFTQKVSEDQKERDELLDNNLLNNSDNKITPVNPEEDKEYLDNLTDEERAKIIKDMKKNE